MHTHACKHTYTPVDRLICNDGITHFISRNDYYPHMHNCIPWQCGWTYSASPVVCICTTWISLSLAAMPCCVIASTSASGVDAQLWMYTVIPGTLQQQHRQLQHTHSHTTSSVNIIQLLLYCSVLKPLAFSTDRLTLTVTVISTKSSLFVPSKCLLRHMSVIYS